VNAPFVRDSALGRERARSQQLTYASSAIERFDWMSKERPGG
jgi:hypothetical protein